MQQLTEANPSRFLPAPLQLIHGAVSAFSLVVLLVMLCEVAYMFGYLSK